MLDGLRILLTPEHGADEDREAPVMRAYATLRGVGFPARIILQALRDGGRINEDEDLDALELEMEANRLAEEESERIEREERLRQMEEDG